MYIYQVWTLKTYSYNFFYLCISYRIFFKKEVKPLLNSFHNILKNIVAIWKIIEYFERILFLHAYPLIDYLISPNILLPTKYFKRISSNYIYYPIRQLISLNILFYWVSYSTEYLKPILSLCASYHIRYLIPLSTYQLSNYTLFYYKGHFSHWITYWFILTNRLCPIYRIYYPTMHIIPLGACYFTKSIFIPHQIHNTTLHIFFHYSVFYPTVYLILLLILA